MDANAGGSALSLPGLGPGKLKICSFKKRVFPLVNYEFFFSDHQSQEAKLTNDP